MARRALRFSIAGHGDQNVSAEGEVRYSYLRASMGSSRAAREAG